MGYGRLLNEERTLSNVLAAAVIILSAIGCGRGETDSGPTRTANSGQSLPTAELLSQPRDLWTRPTGVDWPTFLGPTGDGKSSETGILTDWSNGKLRIVWKTETGQGYGIGSVAAGRFYHFGRIKGKATLRCFHAETGELIWEFAYDSKYQDLYGYDSGPRASPVIEDGRVFIYGVEGMLHCLDAVTGQPIWKLDTMERFGVIQNFFGVASTPVIFEDLLIVMVGGSPDESKKIAPGLLNLIKPNGSGLVALDKTTGEVKYQSIDDLASYSSLKLTTLSNSPIVLAWMRGSLFGVRPQTGESIFEFPWRSRKLESVNASTPVVMDDQVLISECYELGSAFLKIDEFSPSVVWSDQGKRDKALEAHWNTPIVVGDYVYGCSGRHTAQAELRCVQWRTGDVQWKQPGLTRTSLTSIDGHLIVLGEDGQLLLIKASPEKYEVVTRYEPGQGDNAIKFREPCWAAPIISHGLMYVRGKNKLVCFDLIPTKADSN
jgi:outer membrane protein assembly factor BamB